MELLTDCPTEAKSWWGGALSGEQASIEDLPDPDRLLWQAMGGGPAVSVLRERQPRPARSPWSSLPDILRSSAHDFWWRTVVVARAQRSQFDLLLEAQDANFPTPGPLVCLALSGQGFHGQRGRAWATGHGNLYLTALLRPQVRVTPTLLAGLTMLPAVAAVDAVREVSNGLVRPGIKWVNDLMLAGQKIGGVLTATRCQGSVLQTVTFGIGINVSTAPIVSPTPFVPEVGCLAAHDPDLTLGRVFLAMRLHLALRCQDLFYRGTTALAQDYRSASVVLGQQVRVWEEDVDQPMADGRDPLAAGTVIDIEPDLSLRLSGHPDPLRRGRLAFERDCRRLGP